MYILLQRNSENEMAGIVTGTTEAVNYFLKNVLS